MADDIIPAIEQGQGPAPRGGYNAAAPDYRSIQGPEQVRTDLPNSGAAARAAELGQVFKEFEGAGFEYANKASTQAGALAGAAAGATGHPQYKQGLTRFTAYSQAFNNAATGAYAIQAETQADDAAARLRVQANNNPDTFAATFGAVRDAVLKNADPQAVPMLTELYNKHLAAGIAQISGDKALEEKNTQRATYDLGIQRQISKVANLQGSADPQEQLAGQDELVKLSAQIDGGVNAGLYSVAEAKAMHVNAQRAIMGQVFETQVDREIERPDGDVAKLIDNFRQLHEKSPGVLSEDEYQSLVQKGIMRLRDERLLEVYNRANGKSAEQLRLEAGDQKYTTLFLQNNLSIGQLAAAVSTGELKPETARALRSAIANGPVLKSDPKQITALTSDPNFLGMTREEILAWPGISNIDQIRTFDQQQKQRASWEGTQQVKDAKNDISAALHVPAGSLTVSDEDKNRVKTATQDFVNRVAALPPEQRQGAAHQVAQEVIRAQKQNEVRAQITTLSNFRDSAIRNHGPGGSQGQWDKNKMDEYIKSKNDQIAILNGQLTK